MNTLPMHPAEAVQIGTSCFSFVVDQDRVTYFSNLEPFDSHDAHDRRARSLRIARFAVNGIPHKDLQRAFEVSRTTVHRARVQLEQRGEKSFHEKPRGRGPSVMDAATARKAERMLDRGMNGAAVARALGVMPRTLNSARSRGYLGARHVLSRRAVETSCEEPREPEMPSVDRGQRDQRDREAAMGRGARDTTGRVLTSVGALAERPPQFREPLKAVSGGGVLAALPMLLDEGLLTHAPSFLSVPKGYYGLTGVLLLLAFLTLARVRNPEALRHQAPGEWGAILGLDRCPEVKTLRGRISALAQGSVRFWQNALAQSWMAREPDVCATLAVDGHVKVHSGRKGRLPKHFVSRQKLCLPASTSYWINALGGRPFLCLNKDLDPHMITALEHDIVPALEPLLAQRGDGSALTPVFDREGWSPALFRRLAARGVSVITWHRNFKGEPWPETAFRTVRVPIYGPYCRHYTSVQLAEKRITLSAGPEVRQIRRLPDNGRQVPLVTTDFDMSLEEVAGAMFSRWSQENFFKYMRDGFNLDALAVHGLVELDPEARVVNPQWKRIDRRIREIRKRLGSRHEQLARLEKKPASKNMTRAIKEKRSEIDTLNGECEALRLQRKETPERIRVGGLPPDDALDALPESEKLLLDTIRMLAWRAETRMMAAVAMAQGRIQRPGRHLRALFQADADILPDPENNILRVRILGSANNAADRVITPLIEELNQTQTVFPGTNLRLVYELPRNENAGAPEHMKPENVA